MQHVVNSGVKMVGVNMVGVNMVGVNMVGVNMVGMGTVTPHQCAVFSSGVDKRQSSCLKGVGTKSPA